MITSSFTLHGHELQLLMCLLHLEAFRKVSPTHLTNNSLINSSGTFIYRTWEESKQQYNKRKHEYRKL